MRKITTLLLSGAALLGLNSTATTSQATPAPVAVDTTASLPAPANYPKVVAELPVVPLRQLTVAKDSMQYARYSPKRRYRALHHRRTWKGW